MKIQMNLPHLALFSVQGPGGHMRAFQNSQVSSFFRNFRFAVSVGGWCRISLISHHLMPWPGLYVERYLISHHLMFWPNFTTLLPTFDWIKLSSNNLLGVSGHERASCHNFNSLSKHMCKCKFLILPSPNTVSWVILEKYFLLLSNGVDFHSPLHFQKALSLYFYV